MKKRSAKSKAKQPTSPFERLDAFAKKEEFIRTSVIVLKNGNLPLQGDGPGIVLPSFRDELFDRLPENYVLLTAGKPGFVFGQVDNDFQMPSGDRKTSLSQIFQELANEGYAEVLLPTVEAEPIKALSLMRDAWCEAFGLPLPTKAEYEEISETFDQRFQPLRDEYVRRLLDPSDPIGTYFTLDVVSITRLVMHFRGSDCSRGDLKRRKLREMDFSDSNFSHCDLYNADLMSGTFDNANFQGANLRGAVLSGGSFRNATLNKANLEEAIAAHGTNFVGADLRGADLTGANFERADLRGADLTGAKLKNTWLEKIRTDETTKMPRIRKLSPAARKAGPIADSFLPPPADPKDERGVFLYMQAALREFNYSMFFDGLRRWEKGRDPRTKFKEAVAFAKKTASVAAPGRKGIDGFHFAEAILLGYLLSGRIDKGLMDLLPSIRSWRSKPYRKGLPDAGLCQAMVTGKKPAGWDNMMRDAFYYQEHRLPKTWIRSMELHMETVLAVSRKDEDAVLEHLEKEPKQFGYWSGGETFFFDRVNYRRAAVIKFAGSRLRKLKGKIDSKHPWKW